MHILVLPSWYPTKEDPVKGSFFAEQAAALARFGHTVTVMAVYNDGMSGVQTEKCTDGNLTEYIFAFCAKCSAFSVRAGGRISFMFTRSAPSGMPVRSSGGCMCRLSLQSMSHGSREICLAKRSLPRSPAIIMPRMP